MNKRDMSKPSRTAALERVIHRARVGGYDESEHPRGEGGLWVAKDDSEKGDTIRLYHGTRAENVESIRKEGLRPTSSSVVGGAHWFQLTTNKEQARAYSWDGTVIEVKVPTDLMFENVDDSEKAMLWPGHEHEYPEGVKGTAYSVRQQIPPDMIVK